MAERTPVGRSTPPTEEAGDDFPVVIDPARPALISAWGRKGSGKSTFSRRLYASWPWDKLAIDVNGDADPGPDAERITPPLPSRWPATPVGPLEGDRPRYRNLHYRADPGSPTYTDDLDRAVGMALHPQAHRALVWCGEVGEFMPSAHSTGPQMRRLLQQNRHYHATGLFDGPRPVHVNPLVLAQSDLIAIYHLPNPDDRERVAKTMGYPADRFHKECDETFRRGKYWFLLWVAEEHQLYRCAPLPIDEQEQPA
ncbi:hypothetical protein Q6348_08110 [Isoptericola sp. b441]|uniref:Uncharacterized protein n=1 Tax=Actinotalea lenta TaxID=3064654 RepID=A0ABT9D8E5_9CELL|nr:hypothetical protein [Isoptericola sp. b441]MDO8107159.1 hypothetical protein [Isoptericola sp. b441]